jgi:IrrE N-terminal-like domain
MIQRGNLVDTALKTALRVRQAANLRLNDAVCAYDLAEQNGITDVRFVDIPSLEEMYCRNSSTISVSAHRPAGRQAYNCAHGLGHHIFKHGNCISEFQAEQDKKRRFDPDEFLAECFAGFLLMPKVAVSYGFSSRGWDVKSCTPLQVYTVAGWLGVGYQTLIHHMRDSLNLLSPSHAADLSRVRLKQLRSRIIGMEISENIIIVDLQWMGRPIDIEVGDLILAPPDVCSEGASLHLAERQLTSTIYCATKPGLGRLSHTESGWAAYVRVSRRDYVGLNVYRHFEDPDYD